MLVKISNMVIPLLIFYIVIYGILRKQKVYEHFIRGASEGLKTVLQIMPTMVGLMIAVGVLRESGFLTFLEQLLRPISQILQFPSQLISLTIVKMFSSSAATGIALDLFKTYGTDSYIGKIVSISMSCTETIFYTMSVYFCTARMSKTRWTLMGALLSTLSGIIASVLLAKI